MHFDARLLVRALLPVLPLAFCPACGGGGGSPESVQAANPPPPPSVPTQTNRAPTISMGDVGEARVGAAYTALPSASDPDGDTLSYSAENLPPWASLDPGTGRVSGTPQAGDEGAYEFITIAAADASHRAVTSPFSITVVAVASGATGTASLRWQEPGSKLDGSPLDDLAGYRILYGRNSDDLDQSVLVMNPHTTSFDIESLDAGVWYFAVIAVNVNGLEGPPTTPAMKSI
jgi:hypothetical protein